MSFNFTFTMNNVGKYDPSQNSFFFPVHAPILATIKQAYHQADNDTVVIEFENDEQKSAIIYLQMTTKDGKEFKSNHQLFNDLCYLTGANEQGMKLVKGEIEYYNSESKSKEKKVGDVFINLVGKRIGVILEQNHYYSPKYNTIKTNNRVYQLFNAETRQLASQMLNGELGDNSILLEIAENAQASSNDSKKQAEQDAKAQNSASFGGAGFSGVASTSTDDPFANAHAHTQTMGDWN